MWVFFLRAYNDIDHIVPVIDRVLSENHGRVTIVLNDLSNSYLKDFRIQHLLKYDNCKYYHISEFLPISAKKRQNFWKNLRNIEKFPDNLNFVQRLQLHLFGRKIEKLRLLVSKINVEKMCEALFSERNPHFLFFDHVLLPMYLEICDWAKTHGIPSLSLPHAVDNWANQLHDNNKMEITSKQPGFPNWDRYDAIVTPNKHNGSNLEIAGAPPAKLQVIGSTRFSPQWMQKLLEISPKFHTKLPDDTRLKIVFFLTKPHHSIFEAEVLRSIEYIAKFPNVYLVVKPHTRGMRFQFPNSDKVWVDNADTPSGSLIDWSDLILFSATSVILDALRKDKPVLYLRRTVASVLIFERYIQSWTVDCRDQLRDWIWKFLDDKNTRTYSRKEAETCLRETVGKSEDPIADYIKLAKSLSEKQGKSRN